MWDWDYDSVSVREMVLMSLSTSEHRRCAPHLEQRQEYQMGEIVDEQEKRELS